MKRMLLESFRFSLIFAQRAEFDAFRCFGRILSAKPVGACFLVAVSLVMDAFEQGFHSNCCFDSLQPRRTNGAAFESHMLWHITYVVKLLARCELRFWIS